MSLQVWLPLNGNLNNQGLSEVTVTTRGATVASNGKIGSCYSFDTGKYLTVTRPAAVTKEISYSCWVRISSWNESFDCIMSMETGTTWEDNRATLCRNGSSTHLVWNIANGSSSSRISSNTSLSLNTWYHIACTYNGAKLRIYVNGVEDSSADTSLVPNYGSANLYIGASSKSTQHLNGCLNDVRIYDHCLSAKEVKEISKGLICHYKLNNKGFGNSNLTPANLRYSKNSSSTDGWFFMSGSAFTCKPSTTYTISIDIDGTISSFHGGNSSTDATKKYAAIWLYICKTGTSTNATSGDYDTTVWLGSINYNFRKIGETRYAWTYTTPSDARTLALRGNTYSNDSTPIEVNFWNPKIEEGAVATQWCPHSSNSLYTTLGLNSTTEEDCSGLRNNGIAVGNITYKDSSVRYDGCYTFTGDDYIKIPKPLTISNSSYFTIAMWVKPESGCGDYSTILSNFSSPDSGFWMAINTEDSGTWFYNGTYAKGNSLLTVGQWSHIAMVFNAGTITWYTNGVATSTSNVSSRTTAFTDYIAIGNSYSGTTWNTDFVGNISDVRIYSSVLSAEDIKALYDTPASVDKNGTMYAYEFKEE